MTPLYTVFFASGASALIFETLWFRQAGLAFGNSVWASSLILSGFMGGLALGNALAARLGDRLGHPVRLYAMFEATIALTGAGLVYLFPLLGAALAPWLRPILDLAWLLNPLRLLIAFALLMVPATAMGVTLPLLTKALTASDSRFGSVLGRLYGWNTLGAVVGVVLGESYLIGAYGVRGTALLAGALNLAAAAVALWISARVPEPGAAPVISDRKSLLAASPKEWLIAAFVSGFCLLALEVVWFRFLLLFVLGHSVVFAWMLGVVLAGIALGGLAASGWLRFFPDAYRFCSPIAFAAGSLCVGAYGAFPRIIQPFSNELLPASHALEILRIGAPLMFPTSFASGVFFTLVGAALNQSLSSETKTTGVLTLANTVGAALGSLAGGFILLPLAGIESSFLVIGGLYGALGAVLLPRSRGATRMAFAAAGLFLLVIALFPFGSMKRLIEIPVKRFPPPEANRVVAVREGLTETIIYFERLMLGKPAYYAMLTNAYSMSGTPFRSRRYMKLYVYWPMAVHPHLKRALLICYGVGNTAKALTDSRGIETIDVVDISRDILEMGRIVYPETADAPLHDPRVRVHVEDGRYYLQTTEQRFDLITAEPPPPDIAGVVNLYTREYFQLIRDRLAEGGIATYWLPLHSLTDASTKGILRAFCDVFDDCSLWNGMGTNLMMVGTRNAQGPASEANFARQWGEPGVSAEMKRLGLERPEQLGALFIGDADYLNALTAKSPPLTDDNPKLIEAPTVSPESLLALYSSLRDAGAAQERFRRSPFIKRLWPERLIVQSLAYFEFQDIINTYFYGNKLDLARIMKEVHALLTRSSLSTAVLWRLGSDSDIQRIVAEAKPEELEDPAMQFQRGVLLISEREFAAAAEPLSRAELNPEMREDAFAARIFALSMSGQTQLAQRLVEEKVAPLLAEKGLGKQPLTEASLSPFWLWMKKTFGVDPLAGVQASGGRIQKDLGKSN